MGHVQRSAFECGVVVGNGVRERGPIIAGSVHYIQSNTERERDRQTDRQTDRDRDRDKDRDRDRACMCASPTHQNNFLCTF